jgi:4'-phosphopantetheinyl transferase
MPLSLIKKANTGTIGIWELSESSAELLKIYNFSTGEKDVFNKLNIEKRKKEYLAVRLLLKKMTGSKNEIIYNNNGKPHLKNKTLKISISHSDKLAAILLSNRNAGIDVEDTNRKIENIASRFLTKTELENTLKADNPRRMQIIYWSAREAAYKFNSELNINFKTHLKIFPFEFNKEGGKFKGEIYRSGIVSPVFFEYFLYKNNVIVYCVENNIT